MIQHDTFCATRVQMYEVISALPPRNERQILHFNITSKQPKISPSTNFYKAFKCLLPICGCGVTPSLRKVVCNYGVTKDSPGTLATAKISNQNSPLNKHVPLQRVSSLLVTSHRYSHSQVVICSVDRPHFD